jgi:hypothetical protein
VALAARCRSGQRFGLIGSERWGDFAARRRELEDYPRNANVKCGRDTGVDASRSVAVSALPVANY